jgi:hypothetical protein
LPNQGHQTDSGETAGPAGLAPSGSSWMDW